MFPESSTSSRLRYVTSPGPSGTVVWQAWMTSPGNDTTPPPNTPKRVATSEAQVRQVLASTGHPIQHVNMLSEGLKKVVASNMQMDEFCQRYPEILDENARFSVTFKVPYPRHPYGSPLNYWCYNLSNVQVFAVHYPHATWNSNLGRSGENGEWFQESSLRYLTTHQCIELWQELESAADNPFLWCNEHGIDMCPKLVPCIITVQTMNGSPSIMETIKLNLPYSTSEMADAYRRRN